MKTRLLKKLRRKFVENYRVVQTRTGESQVYEWQKQINEFRAYRSFPDEEQALQDIRFRVRWDIMNWIREEKFKKGQRVYPW